MDHGNTNRVSCGQTSRTTLALSTKGGIDFPQLQPPRNRVGFLNHLAVPPAACPPHPTLSSGPV